MRYLLPVWDDLAREWVVLLVNEDDKPLERGEVARFTSLLQAEEWIIAEGHGLYDADLAS